MDQPQANSAATLAALGLSSEAAEQRLAEEGYNELPSTAQRNTLAIALGVAREPMFLLLIASAAIYLTLGDVREAAILAVSTCCRRTRT